MASKHGALRRIFLSTVLAVSAIGAPGPQVRQAEAAGSGAVVVTSGASTAAAVAAAAAAARRRREDAEVTNAAIVNPSEQNILVLVKRGIINSLQAVYVRESIQEMRLPGGMTAKQVTEAQREQLKNLVANKQRVAIVSATGEDVAMARGLAAALAPYFNECKNGRVQDAAGVSYQQASDVMQCMKDQHWEKDTKPVLEGMGLATLAGGAIFGIVLAMKRKRTYGF